MTRRPKIWLAVATGFTLINVAGAVWAAVLLEPLHSLAHVVGVAVGGFWIWALVSRARRRSLAAEQPPDVQLQYLQQSVDAMALEVERIGEAQRFHDRLRAEREHDSPQTS